MIENWSIFQKEIDQIKLNEVDFLLLLQSRIIDDVKKTFILSKLNVPAMYAALDNGIVVPDAVMSAIGMAVSAEQIHALAKSPRANKSSVVRLLIANIQHVDAGSVLEILGDLGGDYTRISRKHGNRFDKTKLMLDLLTVLRDNSIIILDFEPKASKIAVTYIE